MFLSKKSMFKDGSFTLILIQSGTMLHFPRYLSSSRQTWENWFICFERTYVGVVFVTKFPRATIMSLQKSSSKMPKFDFSRNACWATRSGGLVTCYRIFSCGNKDTIK